ncbi:MAG: class I SAM-dependent methyltransferase [Planctomycetes bacterium]|nr:class I SAM-dependent methyltransferase [Planctomycetota bacterium]
MSELFRCCPNCGRDNSDQLQSPFSQADWHLKNCASCRLLYLENVLAYEELEENYAWTKTSEHEKRKRAARRRFTGWIRQKLKLARLRWLPHPKGKNLLRRFVGQGKVLDIGCGSGHSLRQLDDAFIPYGIEIDKGAAEIANAYATERGGRVYQVDALAGLHSIESDQFDGVLMISYLEHEINPLEVLRAMGRVLRPAGAVIIKVPNFGCWNRYLQGSEWPGFRLPDHVNYFTAKTLRQIVTRADLCVAKFNLLDRLPTSDSLWIVARKAS